jgi:Lon protease-like protein
MAATAWELAMFPLGTVLFPSTAIPLHVFEPRYRALTGYCLEHDGRLGVVLIERGSEVGGGDVRFSVGTQARIVESAALPDGRWLLAVFGERRIRVQRWLGEDPFPRAEVTPCQERSAAGLRAAAARDAVVQRAHHALALKAELGEWPPEEVAPELADDPGLAAWQVGALRVLGPADNQRLLETDGVDARLALLVSLLDEQIDVLALRAGGR